MTEVPPGPPAANPDLVRLHTDLIGIVRALDASIGLATSAAQVSLIAGEITEVNARVASVGRHLLQQQTDIVTRFATNVSKAIPAVEQAIQQIEDVKAFIKGIASFLKVVDEVVAAAKLVV